MSTLIVPCLTGTCLFAFNITDRFEIILTGIAAAVFWIFAVFVFFVVISPQLRFKSAMARVRELEDQRQPKLEIAFNPAVVPYFEQLEKDVYMGGATIRLTKSKIYWIKVVNTGGEYLAAVRVVLESYKKSDGTVTECHANLPTKPHTDNNSVGLANEEAGFFEIVRSTVSLPEKRLELRLGRNVTFKNDDQGPWEFTVAAHSDATPTRRSFIVKRTEDGVDVSILPSTAS
ncbi:MAG: hypothetical protein ACKVS6_00255 [Planctomycetota bacterium]